MALQSLNDLYLDHLQDLYSAEQQILKALPTMIEKTSNDKLRDGLSEHLQQTKEHARRLEEIGRDLGIQLGGKTCKGMQGVLAEGDEMLKQGAGSSVLDAAIISAGQRVEHYEMAAYGCARSYASALGRDEDAATLQETLDEEGDADHKLTQLAVTIVNRDATKSIGVEREVGPGAARRGGDIGNRAEPDVRF